MDLYLKNEKSNRNKGMVISFVLHLLILLIAFTYYLPQVDTQLLEEKPPFAVKVDFRFEESELSKVAHEEVPKIEKQSEGASSSQGEAKPEEPKEESAPPAKVEETPSPTPVEKPAEIKVESPRVLNVPKPNIKVPTPTPSRPDERIETKNPAPEAPVKVSTPARTSGGAPSTSSAPAGGTPKGTGTTTGAGTAKTSGANGNVGGTGTGTSGTGSGKSTGTGAGTGDGNKSNGTGAFDESGRGIFGRRPVKYDYSWVGQAKNQADNKVTVKICVDPDGYVTYAEIIQKETRVKDKNVLKNYLKAARNYLFEKDRKAAQEECGKIILEVQRNF
jgi:outer membrane biosynthesis protein TonB